MNTYQVNSKKGKEIFTNVLLHPGELLADELDSRKIKKSHFAAKLGITNGNLSEILHGKRNISAITALKIEKILQIPAAYFLRLQMMFDLESARKTFRKRAA
jgi:HTH-type transcriptional regulator/antitoxin HigA